MKLKKKQIYLIILICFIVFFLLIVRLSVSYKNFTADETVHLSSSLSFLESGDCCQKLGDLHGNLLNAVIYKIFGDDSEKKNMPNVRFVTAIFAVIMIVTLFLWSKEVYGVFSAFIAVILLFNPNIIGNSRVITTDIPSTAMIFLTFYLFWKTLQTNDYKWAIACGVSFGITLLVRISGLFLVPLIVLTTVIYLYLNRKDEIKKQIKKRTLQIAAIFVIAIILLNAGFLFHDTPSNVYMFENDVRGDEGDEQRHILDEAFPFIPKKLYFPVPLYYLQAFANAIQLSKNGLEGYFGGKYCKGGDYCPFIPIGFLFLKNPLILFVLFFLSLSVLKYKKEETYILIPLVFLFVYLFVMNKAYQGIRYLLPFFPFFILYISRVGKLEWLKKKHKYILIGVLLLIYVVQVLAVFPHYISYGNILVKDNKQEWFVDPNLDWHQDEFYLQDYFSENYVEITNSYNMTDPNKAAQKFFYWYSDKDLDKKINGTTGIIALQPKDIYRRSEYFKWLEGHEIKEIVGDSIPIYHIK